MKLPHPRRISIWRSMRVRLAVWSTLVVVVVGFVFGVVSYGWLRSDLEASVEAFAHHETQEIALVATRYKTETELAGATLDFELLFPEKDLIALEVWTVDGRCVISCAQPDSPEPEPWLESHGPALRGELPYDLVSPRIARAARAVGHDSEQRWIAVAVVSRVRVQETLSRYWKQFVLGELIAATLVFAGGLLLVALALRPVIAMVRDARMIAEEGPESRLAVPPMGSELHDLARLLNHMLDRTQDTLARLSRFTSHASHELRTPLTRIRGEAEIALTHESPEGMRETLISILDEVSSLTQIIDALLELARDDPRDSGPPETFDLAELLTDLVNEFQLVAQEKQNVVSLERVEPLPTRGFPKLLSRALWNLLDNALKHTPAATAIRVEATQGPGFIEISISDEGPGVPESELDHIFEPFRRLADGTKVPGYGLGLALSRTVLERHGGSLKAENGSSGGLRLVLRLPA